MALQALAAAPRGARSRASVPAMYRGAIVQGLLSRRRPAWRRGSAGTRRRCPGPAAVWMPRSGKNAMQTPMPKASGDAVRRVLDVEEACDRAPEPAVSSPAAVPARGSGRATPGASGAARRRAQRHAGAPGGELADHGQRHVPDRRPGRAARPAVRRHRQQQLVVLAAVKGQREARPPPCALEAGRARVDGQRRGVDPGRHAALLAQRAEVAGEPVGEVHGRVHEVVLGRARARRRAAARDRAARAGSGARPRARAASRRPWRPARRRRPGAPPARGAAAPRPPRPACPSPPRGRRAARPRAAAARSPPSPSSVTSMTIGPVGGGEVAAHDAPRPPPPRARAARRRARPRTPTVTSRGQAEAHGRVARHAGHGRDVREVDGEGLAAEEARRATSRAGSGRPRPGVGGDEGQRRRSRRPPRRRRRPTTTPGPAGCASAGARAARARRPRRPARRGSGTSDCRAHGVRTRQ